MSATPATSGTAPVQAPTAGCSTHAKLERRALVVDDTDAARLILKRLLEREMVEVVAAQNGDEAVKRVARDPRGFGLIVMDLVMEGGDGIDAIRRIRQLPNAVSCIICPTSSSVSPVLEKECREAGASMQILRKPYNVTSIRRMVLSTFGPSLVPLDMDSGVGETRESERSGKTSNMRGIDIAGALERCCNDAQLLSQMIEVLRSSGMARINNVRVALRGNDLAGVLNQLHNLRGEVLNLGMPGLGSRIFSLEQRLGGGSGVVAQESVHEHLTEIRRELATTLASMLEYPELQLHRYAEPVLGSARPGLDSGRFSALVAAMRRQEVSAFNMVPDAVRILPTTYPPEIEQQFRGHFESLEFPEALRLLRAVDNPDAGLDAIDARHRILIVDDSPTTLRLLGVILQNCGSLRFALSSEQTLEIAREWLPDMVIADIHMSGISGIELCRQLKANQATATAVVIVISTNNDVSNEISALSAGAGDFIEKPINPSRVVARVNSQLAQLDRNRRISQDSMIGDAQQVPLGFITCSFSGNIIEMNPTVAKMAGRSTESFTGKPLSAMFESSQLASVTAQLTNLAKTSSPISMEVVLLGTESVGIPVRMVGWTAPGPGGRVLWIAIEDLRDWRLTERKRIDMRMSSQISSLTGGIAHEFNNLLNVIIGNLDLLSENETDAVHLRRLTAAAKAADRAAEISRRLGDSARTTSASLTQRISLNSLIEEVWPLLVNSLPKKVRVAKECGLDLPSVVVDPISFRDVLLNLMQNAYDAMPSGGTVILRAHAEPAVPKANAEGVGVNAVIEVSDDGTGMTRDVADRAFDPFFTTRSPAHVGLGLAMVRSMIGSIGGVAHILTAPGKGTTVKLSLPAVTPPDESGGNS